MRLICCLTRDVLGRAILDRMQTEKSYVNGRGAKEKLNTATSLSGTPPWFGSCQRSPSFFLSHCRSDVDAKLKKEGRDRQERTLLKSRSTMSSVLLYSDEVVRFTGIRSCRFMHEGLCWFFWPTVRSLVTPTRYPDRQLPSCVKARPTAVRSRLARYG
jgi:hypothetical protein